MPSCKACSCLPAASSYVCSERRADRCRSSWQQSLLPVLVRILSSAPHGTSPECQTLAPNYKLAPHQRTLVATVKTGCAAAPPKWGVEHHSISGCVTRCWSVACARRQGKGTSETRGFVFFRERPKTTKGGAPRRNDAGVRLVNPLAVPP